MNIINLTPHTLNIQKKDGTMLNIEPSGNVARCAEARVDVGTIEGISVQRAEYGEIEELPEPQPNTIYVVSGLVLARTNRADVFAPGKLIRDESGRPIGCDGLSAAPEADTAINWQAVAALLWLTAAESSDGYVGGAMDNTTAALGLPPGWQQASKGCEYVSPHALPSQIAEWASRYRDAGIV